MSKRICLVAAVLLVAACHTEYAEPIVFGISEADPWTVRSRSLLTDSDIENRKTSVTLAAYADGTLTTVGHFVSGLEAMAMDLDPDLDYTLYALVNMGDLTSSIPFYESGLSSLTYRIPSYTEGEGALSTRGLPMAGSLTWPGQGTVIPIQRLLAKVTAHLSCDWDGAAIQDVRVCNLNRILRPFGDAVYEEDWDQQEFDEGTGTSSGTFVFYVPENRQGTIGGITSSLDKSPDQNTTVKSMENELTYLETSVISTESTYAGDITYRSYLGGNATTDFDLERNGLYDWTVVYHGDRTLDQDWKRDGDIFRIEVTADRSEAYVGETVHLTATCYRSNHGTETATDITQIVTWAQIDGWSSNLLISKGNVTATSTSIASFRAVYTINGRTAWAESPILTFRNLPPLSVSWDAEAQFIGQRGSLNVSGLVDGATITEVTSSNESVARKAAVNGSTVYVNYLGATGAATLTIKASNGQTGTFTVTPQAPCLLDQNSISGSTAYYGHPDGSDVNTNSKGHDGLLPSFQYYTGDSANLSSHFSVGTNDSPTSTYTGRLLAPDLYDTILKPILSISDPLLLESAGENRIWVKNLMGYPSEGGVAIGTFTVSPIAACGVQSLTEIIYSVDPFSGMAETAIWPDFNDMGMLVQYIDCEDYHQSIRISGMSASFDWDVKLAGEWNAKMKARFSGNGNYLFFDYTEGDPLPHIGGLCEVQWTVTNQYSGEKVGKTFLSFNVFVWGAIGGLVVLDSSTKFSVKPAYVGPVFAQPSQKVFSTIYAHEEGVEIYGPSGSQVLNGTVNRDNVGHGLDEAVYTITLSFGSIVRKEQVYRSICPNLTYSGNPGQYYHIALLSDIQTKFAHPDFLAGWITE